jgi:hypothetical protein
MVDLGKQDGFLPNQAMSSHFAGPRSLQIKKPAPSVIRKKLLWLRYLLPGFEALRKGDWP